MTARIYEWAHFQPNKIAFIDDGHLCNYAQFARAITTARVFFENHKLTAGQTAIVLSGTAGTTWVLVLALRELGLNTVAVQSAAQAQSLNLTDVATFVTMSAQPNAKWSNGKSPTDVSTIVVPSEIFASISAPGIPHPPNSRVKFGGHILFTSGTTGTYKKLLLEGQDEFLRNEAVPPAYPLLKDTIYHACNFGLWTTVGFRMAAAVWHVGGTVIYDNRRDSMTRFFEHNPTLAILTPPMLGELLKSKSAPLSDREFELLITAGFMPSSLAKEATHRFRARIGTAYGSSELGSPVMMSRSAEALDWYAPSEDRIVRIVDEHGEECATGQEGEIEIRLERYDCMAYLNDADASARIFRDGFFCPGDMVVKRADGRIRLLGRTADVLNVNGRKISVAPIEQELQRLLAVDEVCLFSGVNDAGEPELVIALQTSQALQRSQLKEVARKFNEFEKVRFKTLKEFPRTSTGTQKTRRSALRNLVYAQKGS